MILIRLFEEYADLVINWKHDTTPVYVNPTISELTHIESFKEEKDFKFFITNDKKVYCFDIGTFHANIFDGLKIPENRIFITGFISVKRKIIYLYHLNKKKIDSLWSTPWIKRVCKGFGVDDVKEEGYR